MKNQLKVYRAKKGLSQDKLSESVGITRAYLSNIETGKQVPSISVAYKLAKALGTTTDKLFNQKKFK